MTGVSMGPFRSLTFDGAPAPVPPADLDARLPRPNSLRRAGEGSKVAVLVASEVLRAAGVEVGARTGVYVGQQQVALDYCAEFIDSSYRNGPRLASPMLFSESVANNAATHLSLTLKVTGVVQTFIGSRATGIQALQAAAEDLSAGVIDSGLAVVLSFSNALTSDAFNSLFRPYARARRPEAIRFRNGGVALLLRRAERTGPAPPRIAYAGVRVAGPDVESQSCALRGLWGDYRARHPRPASLAASAFCLARRQGQEVLRRALGDEAPRLDERPGEAFALDPVLQLLDGEKVAGRAVICLGEEGSTGLIALETR